MQPGVLRVVALAGVAQRRPVGGQGGGRVALLQVQVADLRVELVADLVGQVRVGAAGQVAVAEPVQQLLVPLQGGPVVPLLLQGVGEEQVRLRRAAAAGLVVAGLRGQPQVLQRLGAVALGQVLPAEVELRVEVVRLQGRGLLQFGDGMVFVGQRPAVRLGQRAVQLVAVGVERDRPLQQRDGGEAVLVQQLVAGAGEQFQRVQRRPAGRARRAAGGGRTGAGRISSSVQVGRARSAGSSGAARAVTAVRRRALCAAAEAGDAGEGDAGEEDEPDGAGHAVGTLARRRRMFTGPGIWKT